MKIIAVIVPLLFFAHVSYGATAQILEWRDGDTFTAWLHECTKTARNRWQCGKIGVRILGINTPESKGKAKCQQERDRSEQAKRAAEKLAPVGSTVWLKEIKEDKYAGRILAIVTNINGVDIGGELLKRGLARSYHGERRDPLQWCPNGSSIP